MDPSLPGGVLALDLSSMVGWAYGGLDSPAPLFGCWRLPPVGGEGARYATFENELVKAMRERRPGRLVLEAALSLQALAASSNIQVTRQQLTLRGIAYAEAYRASVPICEIDSFTVRQAMIGVGRFPKGQAKIEVIRHCKGRGWNVPDDNSADACLTWAWHTTQLRGGRPVAGRLFAERVQ
jgi:Holliday junction resolvasome RuvABC endonuclease subunit